MNTSAEQIELAQSILAIEASAGAELDHGDVANLSELWQQWHRLLQQYADVANYSDADMVETTQFLSNRLAHGLSMIERCARLRDEQKSQLIQIQNGRSALAYYLRTASD